MKVYFVENEFSRNLVVIIVAQKHQRPTNAERPAGVFRSIELEKLVKVSPCAKISKRETDRLPTAMLDHQGSELVCRVEPRGDDNSLGVFAGKAFHTLVQNC